MKFKKLFLLLLSLLFVSPSAFATKTKCAKVVIVGNLASGKTAIFKKMMGEEYQQDDEIKTKSYRIEDICEIVGDTVLLVKVFDTPGLKEYREEVISKLADTDMVYFVIDVTKGYSGEAKEFFGQVYKAIKDNAKPDCKTVFLLSKYDVSKDFSNETVENIRLVKDIQEIWGDEYLLISSIDSFQCNMQKFIHSKNLKNHMIEYLKQHINELPDKHEPIIVRSDWEIGEDIDRANKEAEKQRQEAERQKKRADDTKTEFDNYVNSHTGGCSIQ